MTDWTSGYVADIGYTYGYYNELNPLRAGLALAQVGLAAPTLGTACELGFGQGLSLNAHAAAGGLRWWGTDFNPAQAAFAQHLQQASGSAAQLSDAAFAEFCGREDLPAFDFIGLHGIWSWISDENRRVIVDFLQRKLKVGGVLYISYNTQPGWAPYQPLRHLLTEYAHSMGRPGAGVSSRIDEALAFAERLLETDPLYARANPRVAQRLKTMQGQDRAYLAHEYFNRDWHPMPFAELARWLAGAKLDFACSAHFLDQVEELNLTEAQRQLLAELPDPVLRQTVRDLMCNVQFRRDYWVKGARPLDPMEREEALRRQQVVLTTAMPDLELVARGVLGEASLNEPVYRPILAVLADYQPKTLDEIATRVASQGLKFAQVVEAVLILLGKGDVAVAQAAAPTPAQIAATARLNHELARLSRGMPALAYLASPVTGGGVPVSRFQQLFLLAMREGATTPAALAEFVWRLLSAQGHRLTRDGAPLMNPQDNLTELTERATLFMERYNPILQALGVVLEASPREEA
jgi:hypothetical protein